MAVKEYNPGDVVITYGGRVISGFADGTFVNVSRNENAWSLQVGTDGEGTRSKSNNRSGQFSFSLMQSSDSNEYLSGLALVDEQSGDNALPLQVKDNSGTSIYNAETAWIVKVPDSEFSREAGPREWVLETDVLVSFVGKN